MELFSFLRMNWTELSIIVPRCCIKNFFYLKENLLLFNYVEDMSFFLKDSKEKKNSSTIFDTKLFSIIYFSSFNNKTEQDRVFKTVGGGVYP